MHFSGIQLYLNKTIKKWEASFKRLFLFGGSFLYAWVPIIDYQKISNIIIAKVSLNLIKTKTFPKVEPFLPWKLCLGIYY